MADSKISGLPSGVALTGTEEVPIVQSGSTVKTTTQDIADLVSSENLGTDDLTISDNGRILKLSGNLATNTMTIQNSGGVDIIKFKGNNDIDIYDSSSVNYAQFDESQEKFKGANADIGSIGTASQYSLKVYSRLASTSGVAQFFNSSGGVIFDFRQASDSGSLGVRNSGGTTNVFLNGSSGDITSQGKYICGTNNGVGGTTGTTYTFGGGCSGDVASLTISGGIVTAITTVP